MSVKELCRACLCSTQSMYSLLDSIVPKLDSPPSFVVDMWKIFDKMLTATEDSYPDKICTTCLAEIQRTYTFMLKCEKSDDILKKMKNIEIHLKKLANASNLPEDDSSENVNSENDTNPNVSRIKPEKIEWNGRKNGFDTQDIDKGQFHAIVDGQVALPSQHMSTLNLRREDVNLEIELFDHFSSKDDYVTNDRLDRGDNEQKSHTPSISYRKDDDIDSDDIIPIQHIKQEPDLDLCTENDEFDIEFEDETSTELITCPGCTFQCTLLESLEKHIIDNHMEGRMCKLCNQEFEYSIIEHYSSKHWLKSLINPSKRYRREQQFKCESCSKTFTRKHGLIEHLRWHTGERPFKCDICPKTFTRKQYLRNHLIQHTGERPFKCESCPKAYIYKRELVNHLRQHTVDGPFKCEICSKAYTHKRGFNEHIKRHMGEGRLKCKSCSKTFKCKPYLMEHLKCHTGERPFRCEICSKTFARKSTLNNHLIYHTGERPFKCNTCTKTFQRKSSLTYHLRHQKEHIEDRTRKLFETIYP